MKPIGKTRIFSADIPRKNTAQGIWLDRRCVFL